MKFSGTITPRVSLVRRLAVMFAICLSILALGRCGALQDVSEPATEGDRAPADIGLPTAGGSYRVVFVPRPDPIPLNEPFTLEVTIIDATHRSLSIDDIRLAVDGRMPQHRHGMNREPRISAEGEGRFVVDGMLFHMPGEWVLSFDVSRNGVTERAQIRIMLD